MNKAKVFLTFFLWFCMVCIAMGQSAPKHDHRPGEKCLDCRASEVNEDATRKEAEYLKTRSGKARTQSARVTTPPDDFEYVIPVVFHVFGAEYNNGVKITVDLIRKALEETNKDFWGLQADWQQLHPERDPFKCPMKITFRLAEKDPDGKLTNGVTFHDWKTGFGNGGGYDDEIRKYAWDNYRYMNVYIMQDLYNDGATNNSGVAWYPTVWMSDANLARVVYNGTYLGTNTDSEFRSVLSHEFGHFFNLKHTFEGCENGQYTYPNDEIDDTPVHLKDPNLKEGDKNPFGEVIDVSNFMNYPRQYKNFTKDQVTRMKAALMHEARVSLWQEENHRKVFYTEPTPRIDVVENTIHETIENDGSFTAVYKILLKDCNLKVAEGEYLAETDYTVKDLPAGVTLKLKVAPDHFLEGEFSGKCTAHAAKDGGSFSVTLKNSMLEEGTILNPVFTLNYTFRDEFTIVYGSAGDISASPSNSWTFFSLGIGDAEYGAWYIDKGDIVDAYKFQSYKKPLVAYPGTLNIKPLPAGFVIDENASWETPKDDYAGAFYLKSPDYKEWVGQNAYIGIQFTADGATLYGWMNVTFNADGKGYTIHDWAYNSKPGSPIKAGETVDGVPQKLKLSPPEVYEDDANDGTVARKVSLQISGGVAQFTKSGLLVAGTDYQISGIPEGLTVKISLTDKTNGIVEVSGKVTQHAKSDGKTIKIEFAKTLVDNNNVGGLTQKLKIVFKDPYGIVYYDMDDLWCASQGTWGQFNLGIGNAKYEVWYAEKLGGKFKLVSANNPLVVHKGTSNIVALEFGQMIGATMADNQEWKQQKTGVPQPEIDQSMLDVKSDEYLDWVGKSAYVGIQFVNEGLVHYGWLGIRFEADGQMMTVEDWAYNETPGEPIQAGYKEKNQKPYLSWDGTQLSEPIANDGRLDSVFVRVKGTEFAIAAGEKLIAGTHYTADALPSGLTLAVEIIDPMTAQIQLIGKAANHAVADSVKNWNIAFKDAAFAKAVLDKEHKYDIYFRDPFGIIYVDIADVVCNASSTFTHIYPVVGSKAVDFAVWFDKDESALRFEAYEQNVICTNSGVSTAFVKPLDKGYLVEENDLWNIGGEWPNEHWIWGPKYTDWAGKEAYLGFAFKFDGYMHFGWMRLEVAEDGTSYVVKDLAYHSAPKEPIRAGDKGIPEPSFLITKNTTFHEGMDNDGAVTDSVAIDLVFGKFAKASGVLQAGTDYTVDEIGEGLALVAELRGDEKVMLKVTGKAVKHDKAASLKNIKFTFNDAAFAAGTNLSKKIIRLGFEFLDPYKVIYADIPNVECSRYNMWTTLEIDGNIYGIWYDVDNRLSLRLETYEAPLVCEGTSRNIALVKAGEIIGGASNWVEGGEWPNEHFIDNPDYTAWRDQEAYIGIKYDFNGRTRYGWIRIEVAADGQSYIVKDYAYNEVFNEPIMAGAQTQQNLMVSFAADKPGTYEGFDVDFTNYTYSALPVESYKWTFEGGSPAVFEGEKPGKITYNTAGSYAVGLEVKTADTTVTLIRKDYIIIEPVMLKADYTVSALNLVEGGKVAFTDASTGSFDITKWEWTFKGGQPASFEGQNPGEVTYATAGDYEVILKVTDDKGRVHTRFATPGVTVFPADFKDYCQVSVTPPTENTYCYIKNVIVGEQNNESGSGNYTDYSRTVFFAAQKGKVLPFDVELNDAREVRVMTWIDWNGNGVFEESEVAVNYIAGYDKPEKLTITVPETATDGIVGMRIRVKIGDSVLKPCDDEGYYGEIEDYSLIISEPAKTGDILADKQNIKNGEYVTFRANINEITASGVESYKWIFEGAEPATSAERVPAPVQYTEVGVHPVVLELTLQDGEKKIVEKKNFIVVNPATTLAKFEASAADIVKGGSVKFTDRSESSAGIAAWAWTFEGGTPSTFSGQTPPEVVYNQAGSYEVILKITDVNGETNTRIEPLMVEVYENTNSYCQIAERGSYYSMTKVAIGDQKHETEHAPAHWVNDFTNFAFVLSKDSALPFTVDLSMDGTPAKVMAWIDWNQDGTFDEVAETIARYQDDVKPAEIMVSVPADAKEGATRMRVRTSYYNYRTPCDQMESMGELEDYTVIVKKERPAGYIVADNTNPAIAEQVQFTAFVNQITDENVTAYKWTFTGGTPAQSTVRKPAKVTYAAEGVYDVTLELTLEGGVKKNITMYDFITVGEKAPEVNVNFTASPVELFAGSSVDFSASATGTGSVTGYAWTFEGGMPATSVIATPAVSYAASGEYDVTLVATLNDGSQRTVKKSNYITVNPFLLRADFKASATKVNSGADVTFTNESVGADTYSWNFGDGSAVVTTENAIHAFAAAGTYTVTLTVTGNGETQTKSAVISVSAMKGACAPGASYWQEGVYLKLVKFGSVQNDVKRTGTNPYFDFTGNEAFAMTPGESVAYEIQFASNWGPLNATAWIDWDNSGDFSSAEIIADGSLASQSSITGTVVVPAGLSDRLVRLRIVTGYNGEGVTMDPCSDGYSVEDYSVRIGAAGGDDDLVMNITADKLTVRENEAVTLSVEGAPADATYAWTLTGAETTSSTEAQPIVSYAVAGAYDVQVVVTPQGGNARTLEESRFIVVNMSKLSADFTADKTMCAVGEEVSFTSISTSTADIESLEWTFEGGAPATSTVANPVVTYAIPGKYAVTLKVTDKFGKTDTKVMPAMIEAKEFIKADFIASAMTVAVGETVSFTNRSVAAASYTWTFDNGEPSTSTEANPTVSFKVKGAAMVTLVAEDADGKRSVKSEVLTVTSKAFGAIQLGDLVQEYDGTVKAVSYTTTPAELKNDIRIVYKQGGVEVMPKDAGMYEVMATYTGTIPYSVETVNAQLEIRKMPVQIVASNLRQTYTGEILKADILTVPAGYENLVTAKYMLNGEEVSDLKNSGNYQLMAELEADNYMAEPLNTVFAIRKIAGEVSIVLEKQYIYDGTPKYVARVKTIPADLEVNVTYDGKEEGAVAVGGHTVVATITDMNYEGAAWETMNIKPAEPKIKIEKSTFVYDGLHHDVEFTTVPENLDYEITYRKDGDAVNSVVDGGIYGYTVQIIDENYDTRAIGEIEITKALAAVRISDLHFTYDGETKKALVETNPKDLAVDVTYNGFSQLPYAAGEYIVFAEILDQNYRGYKTATMLIVRGAADMKVMDLVISDGTHDCIFRIPDLAGVKKSLVMYNQQGSVIYETKEYYDDYDMRDLPAGTYYYILKYVDNGKPQTIKSFVEVIRK